MNCNEKKAFDICEFCKSVNIPVAHTHTKETFYTAITVLAYAEKKKRISGLDKALDNGS